MITSGELYVTDHVRDDVQTFPLASTNVKKISASGDTVAILQSPSPEDDMQVWLTIWTMKSNGIVHCRAKSPRSPLEQATDHQMKIMIGTDKDYVILFEQWLDAGGCLNYSYTRFCINGLLHSPASLRTPRITNLTTIVESSTTSDLDSSATVWSYYRSHYPDEPDVKGNYVEFTRVQYSLQQNKLQLITRIIDHLSMECTSFFFRKDVTYYLSRHLGEFRIIDWSDDWCRSATTMCKKYARFASRAPGSLDPLLGDEKFLVLVCDRGFQAWCFDKDTKLSREYKGYAQHRETTMQERLKRNRVWDQKALARMSR